MLGVCMPSAAPPQPGLLEVTSSQRRKDVQTRTRAKRVLEETGVHTSHPLPHHVSHSQVCSGAGSPPGPSSPLLPLLPLFSSLIFNVTSSGAPAGTPMLRPPLTGF